VIEEVGTEEKEKPFKVHNLRVFSTVDDARARVGVCHY
jgi:hypothetical protein